MAHLHQLYPKAAIVLVFLSIFLSSSSAQIICRIDDGSCAPTLKAQITNGGARTISAKIKWEIKEWDIQAGCNGKGRFVDISAACSEGSAKIALLPKETKAVSCTSDRIPPRSKGGCIRISFLKAKGAASYEPVIALTDEQKQQKILNMVKKHCTGLSTELVLAMIAQEGGENTFYGGWAQPSNNGDGIMQVTSASGHHEASGTYTNDEAGYEHAILDGCAYLKEQYSSSKCNSLVYATQHYNTGPSSLFTYMGDKNEDDGICDDSDKRGDRLYLSNIAGKMNGIVRDIYGLKNSELSLALSQGQDIVDKYFKKGIMECQLVDYYKPYETKLNNEICNIAASSSTTTTTTIPSPSTENNCNCGFICSEQKCNSLGKCWWLKGILGVFNHCYSCESGDRQVKKCEDYNRDYNCIADNCEFGNCAWDGMKCITLQT